MTERRIRGLIAPLLAVALGGCVFPDIDTSNFPCPCASGYVCVADRCVSEGDGGQSGQDSGPDIDAANRDGGLPATECRTGGVLGDTAFCDGFENPGLAGWGYDVGRGNATDATAAEMMTTPYRGARALRALIDFPNSYAELVTCPFRRAGACPAEGEAVGSDEVVTAGDIYMRAYVYLPSSQVVGHLSFMHMGLHRGDVVDRPMSVNLEGNGLLMYVSAAADAENSGHFPEDGVYPAFPRDRWVCVRSHVFVAPAPNGEAHTWIDDDETPVVEVTGKNTLTAEPYLHFGLGIGWSGPQDEIEMYFDEVGISRTPIPCD